MTERRMYLASSREEPSEQSKNVIPGFEQLTPQQVFDISAAHLLKQGKRSMAPNGNDCAYRGVGGLQCAAGPFVTDDFARGNNIISWQRLAEEGAVPKTNLGLICMLQYAHDKAYDLDRAEMKAIENWSKVVPALKQIAEDFKLEYNF